MNKRAIGKESEDMALKWMLRKGWHLKVRNWQSAHREIDLIMENNQKRVFVEVKSNSAYFDCFPEQQINREKRKNILHSMNHFNKLYPTRKRIQIDVVAITHSPFAIQLYHIHDAFFGINNVRLGNRSPKKSVIHFNGQGF